MAQKTCKDCLYFKPPGNGNIGGMCALFNQYKEYYRNACKSVLTAQMKAAHFNEQLKIEFK